VALVDHHKQFHQAAAAVAETISSGQKDQGIKMMDGGTRFAIATQAVVVAIKGLMREVATRKHSVAGRSPSSSAGAAHAPSTAAGYSASAHSGSKAQANAPAAPGDDWETF
jgi:hypothetical protein